MKKLRSIRILILTGGALMLLQGPRAIRSQQIMTRNHECYASWDTESYNCDSCCQRTTSYTVIDEAGDTSPGQNSSAYVQDSCNGATHPGSPDYCTNSYCGNFDYYMEYTDSTCCQSNNESCDPDDGNDDCCTGLVCNSTHEACMNCLGNQGSCGADNDCCSGNCSNGACCSSNFLQQCGTCGNYTCNGTCNDPCNSGDGGGGGGGGGDGCGGPGACGNCVQEGYNCFQDCDCAAGLYCGEDGDCDADGYEDPIIVDLSGAGFPLTNFQNGVDFDFFGKGRPFRMAWTVVGANVGWLALDRNGNGRIDDGGELFSNVAPQPPGTKLGFRALAVYDQPANGGNGDGVIDQRDAVFPKLLVWVDKNHNGVSDPGELLTMQQAGIQSISIHYEFSNWTDAYGNQFRYRGKITFTNGVPAGDQYIFDVLLATAK